MSQNFLYPSLCSSLSLLHQSEERLKKKRKSVFRCDVNSNFTPLPSTQMQDRNTKRRVTALTSVITKTTYTTCAWIRWKWHTGISTTIQRLMSTRKQLFHRIKFEIDDDKIYEEDETSATQKERESTHYTDKIRKNGSNVLKQ